MKINNKGAKTQSFKTDFALCAFAPLLLINSPHESLARKIETGRRRVGASWQRGGAHGVTRSFGIVFRFKPAG
jgi:hypothetical protein